MPLLNIVSTITNGFGRTLGSIGMVTGLGVMLGRFMYEAGGIEAIATAVLGKFGDVVYIMFASMLRALSKKTDTSKVNFA